MHSKVKRCLCLFVCARRLAKAIRILPRIRSTRAVALGIDFDQRIQVDRVLLPEKMLYDRVHVDKSRQIATCWVLVVVPVSTDTPKEIYKT